MIGADRAVIAQLTFNKLPGLTVRDNRGEPADTVGTVMYRKRRQRVDFGLPAASAALLVRPIPRTE